MEKGKKTKIHQRVLQTQGRREIGERGEEGRMKGSQGRKIAMFPSSTRLDSLQNNVIECNDRTSDLL